MNWEVDHLKDEDYDASLIPFPSWENSLILIPRPSVRLPQQVYFRANLKTLETLDFPYNDVRWPLFSKRFLSALLKAGPFPHRLINIVMLDDRLSEGEHFNANGELIPATCSTEFCALELTPLAGLFDFDNSVYDPDEIFPEDIGSIDRLVLLELPGGYPSLFRIVEYPTLLFLSPMAQKEMKAACVRGFTLTPLAEYRS